MASSPKSHQPKAWSKEEEISLLEGILEYYRIYKMYPFDDDSNMNSFYLYRSNLEKEVLSDKMIDLPERFFTIQDAMHAGQNVVASMDRLDMQIYQLSCKIWGQEDDGDDQYMMNKITLGGPDDPIDSYVRLGKNQEIDLLNDMVEFYKEEGIYPYEHVFAAMQKFFEFWKKKRGINGSEDLLKEKISELYKRFLEQSNKKSPVMDQIDDTIYQLCENLWGEKNKDRKVPYI